MKTKRKSRLSFVILACLSFVLVANHATAFEKVWSKPSHGGSVDCSPVYADVAGDGVPEIVMASTTGVVMVWDVSGNEIWQRDVGQVITTPPTVADLFPGGGKEICVIDQAGKLTCLSSEGNVLWQFQFPAGLDWNTTTIVAEDLNHNGSIDILAGDKAGNLVCLSGDGSQQWTRTIPGEFHCPPAVGDLTGNRLDEIVITTGSGMLQCLNADGTLRWESALGSDNHSGPVIADLQNDGSFEILVGGADGILKCADANGRILWRFAATAEIDSSIAVADLDGDGTKEIFFADLNGMSFLLDANGRERWRYALDLRERRSPALADLDGDGEIEILVTTHGPHLYLLSADGQPKDLVTLFSGTNTTPTVVDLDGHGRLGVINPLESGPVECYTWLKKAPPAPLQVLWGQYRVTATQRGSLIKSKPADSVAVLSVDYGLGTVGANTFSVEISNPKLKELTLSLQIEKHPQGTYSKSSDKIIKEQGKASLQYVIRGQYPETLSYRYTVTESQSGKILFSQEKRRYFVPFDRDIELVEQALSSLRVAAQGSPRPTPHPLPSQFYHDQYVILSSQFHDLSKKVKRYFRLTGSERFALANRLVEIRKKAREASQEAEYLTELMKCKQEAPIFVAWPSNPWAQPRPPWKDDSYASQKAKLSVSLYKNEYGSGAINIENISDQPLFLRVETEGELFLKKHGIPRAALSEVISVPTEKRDTIADALAEMNQGNVIHIAPREIRQIWITIHAKNAQPTSYTSTIRFRSLTPESISQEIPLEVEVLPLDITAAPAPAFCNWAYVYSSCIKEFPEEARKDLASHGTNVFVVTSYHTPAARYDEKGNLVGGVDFTRHDSFINRYKNNGMFLFFSYQHVIKGPKGHGYMSDAYKKAYETWIKLWVRHLADLGVGYDQFALYPIDEPGLRPGLVDRYVEVSSLTRKIDPRILLYADPVARATMADIQRMAPFVDIWCPNRGSYLLKDGDKRLDVMRKNAKSMWTYECADNAKHQAPLGYYRGLAWLALKRNLTGIGFWSYCTSNFDPWFLPKGSHDYLLIYPGKGVLSSKRWEACRDGLEDMRAVTQLRNAIETARKTGKHKDQIADAERCIREAIECLCGYNLEPVILSEDSAPENYTPSSQKWLRYKQYRSEIARYTLRLRGME